MAELGLAWAGVRHRPGPWLLLALGLYVLGALLTALQGWLLNRVVQRTMYRLRGQVQQKLNRLPLKYFDTQPREMRRITVAGDVPVSIDGRPSVVRSGNADHFSSIDHLIS